MRITFKDLRELISKIDRVSICMRETLEYDNYPYMKDVPQCYDEYYVYGIGRISSEFKIADALNEMEVKGNEINEEYFIGECMEIMLSKEPLKG